MSMQSEIARNNSMTDRDYIQNFLLQKNIKYRIYLNNFVFEDERNNDLVMIQFEDDDYKNFIIIEHGSDMYWDMYDELKKGVNI